MVGKAIPIHNVRFHPPIKDPTAPPKKKIAINSPFNRLRISGLNEKIKRWLSTRFADTPCLTELQQLLKQLFRWANYFE